MAEAGLRINGKFYPVPTRFTIGETRTIKRMTGLSLPEFGKALNRLDPKAPDHDVDPDVLGAFVWVTMHREDPTVTPETVDALEFDEIRAEGDAVPPSIAKPVSEQNGASLSSASELSERQELSSEPTPEVSGNPV